MNNTKFFKVLRLISSLVAVTVIATGAYFSYEFYKEHTIEQATTTSAQSPSKEPESKDSSSPIDWDEIKANVKKDEKEQEEIVAQTPIKTLAPPKKRAQKQKPLLAIIMDDMAYRSQLNDLQKLSLPITPSFFPVSPDSPNTAKLAASVPFYMVHLPLEAQIPQQSRQNWILVGSSQDDIRTQIATIKEQFPKLTFINNHTGSRFTSSKADMTNLLQVLQEFGIEFVDSRTSADTAIPALYKQENRQLLARDVFLDNTPSVIYTTNQLKQAIKIAKKKGYAIAICHPHQSTFKALANAKHKLFKEVELVYIKDLPIARTLLAQNLAKKSALSPKPVASSLDKEPTTPTSTSNQSEMTSLLDTTPKQAQEMIQKETSAQEQIPSIPRNAYLDSDTTQEPIKPESKDPIDLATQDNTQNIDKEVAKQAQATKPDESIKSPVKAEISNLSKIDTTIFKEAKRASLEQKTSKAQQTKPKAKSQTKKAYENIQECAQDEVQSFISGCPSNKAKKKQGFINIEWHNDEQKPRNKPKDFLDPSEF